MVEQRIGSALAEITTESKASYGCVREGVALSLPCQRSAKEKGGGDRPSLLQRAAGGGFTLRRRPAAGTACWSKRRFGARKYRAGDAATTRPLLQRCALAKKRVSTMRDSSLSGGDSTKPARSSQVYEARLPLRSSLPEARRAFST